MIGLLFLSVLLIIYNMTTYGSFEVLNRDLRLYIVQMLDVRSMLNLVSCSTRFYFCDTNQFLTVKQGKAIWRQKIFEDFPYVQSLPRDMVMTKTVELYEQLYRNPLENITNEYLPKTTLLDFEGIFEFEAVKHILTDVDKRIHMIHYDSEENDTRLIKWLSDLYDPDMYFIPGESMRINKRIFDNFKDEGSIDEPPYLRMDPHKFPNYNTRNARAYGIVDVSSYDDIFPLFLKKLSGGDKWHDGVTNTIRRSFRSMKVFVFCDFKHDGGSPFYEDAGVRHRVTVIDCINEVIGPL